LKKLFDEIAPQFATRPGGYTRIVKLGQRRGDGAQLAKLELLIPKAAPKSSESKGKSSKGALSRFRRKSKAKAAESETKADAEA
jgi:large subunit ribosomal protein L17